MNAHISEVLFSHAGKSRKATIGIGWEQNRLLDSQQKLGLIVAEEVKDKEAVRGLVLLSNVTTVSVKVRFIV